MEKKPTGLKIHFPQDSRPFSQQLTEFLDTTVGRDKIFRLFQYYAKFILPFIKNKEKLLKIAGFFESFGAMCGLTRKVNIHNSDVKNRPLRKCLSQYYRQIQ